MRQKRLWPEWCSLVTYGTVDPLCRVQIPARALNNKYRGRLTEENQNDFISMFYAFLDNLLQNKNVAF